MAGRKTQSRFTSNHSMRRIRRCRAPHTPSRRSIPVRRCDPSHSFSPPTLALSSPLAIHCPSHPALAQTHPSPPPRNSDIHRRRPLLGMAIRRPAPRSPLAIHLRRCSHHHIFRRGLTSPRVVHECQDANRVVLVCWCRREWLCCWAVRLNTDGRKERDR